jgi:hypothetical protein
MKEIITDTLRNEARSKLDPSIKSSRSVHDSK